MKWRLLGFGAVSALVISGATAIAHQLTHPSASATAAVMTAQLNAATVVKAGKFVKGEHPTVGTARIVSENGKQFLELDRTFKTDQGPDLYVILYRKRQPPILGIRSQDYVSLGRLQKTAGSQRYAIPRQLKVAEFSAAAIWCRQFNATFGYATFGRQDT